MFLRYWFVERNGINSAPTPICRQLYLMQRYCQRVQRKFTFNLSSAVISYAKILPTRTKKVYFQFVECSYILCKVTGKFGIGKIMGRVFHFFRVLSYFEWRGKATKKPDYCRAFLFCWLYELLLTSHVI